MSTRKSTTCKCPWFNHLIIFRPIHFYSASPSMSLSEALPTTAIDTVAQFTRRSATGNCKWRICSRYLRGDHQADSNPRHSGRKASTLPMRHHAPRALSWLVSILVFSCRHCYSSTIISNHPITCPRFLYPSHLGLKRRRLTRLNNSYPDSYDRPTPSSSTRLNDTRLTSYSASSDLCDKLRWTNLALPFRQPLQFDAALLQTFSFQVLNIGDCDYHGPNSVRTSRMKVKMRKWKNYI